jgi:hypothetical protein
VIAIHSKSENRFVGEYQKTKVIATGYLDRTES